MIRNISGTISGRLTAIEFVRTDNGGNSLWKCRCQCGKEVIQQSHKITHGHVVSCGCYRAERVREAKTTHGHSIGHILTPEYKAWARMKTRVKDTRPKIRKNYLDKGIKVCLEWSNSFEAFFKYMGPCPPGYSLDRKDGNKGYEPSNCRWADYFTQNNNMASNRFIEWHGKRLTIAQWGREIGIPRHNIYLRLRAGWSIEKTLTTPVEFRTPRKKFN